MSGERGAVETDSDSDSSEQQQTTAQHKQGQKLKRDARQRDKTQQMSALMRFNLLTSVHNKDLTSVDYYFDKGETELWDESVRSANAERGWRGVLRNKWIAVQPWLLLTLLSVCTACVAVASGSVTQLLISLRSGVCMSGPLLLEGDCCHGKLDCADFVPWSSVLGGSSLVDFGVYLFCGLALASGAAALVSWYAPYSAGSGIPECQTIVGGFVIRRYLGFKTLLVKSVGLVMAVASGLEAGTQGPLVHIACCIANILSRRTPSFRSCEFKKREILACAFAAGVAAAFGAPVGGVLFAVETVGFTFFPGKTMVKAFFTSVVTVLTMQFIAQGTDMTAFRLVDPAKNGKDQAAWFGFEVLPFALLGILGGILGSFFIRLNLTVQAFRAGNPTAKANPVRLVAFLSLCTLLISYRNVYLHHGSAYLLDELFQDCSIKKEWQSDISKQLCDGRTWSNMLTLLLVFMIKFALTVVSFGLSVPVGLFVPSLCAGACLGRIVGWGVELLHADFGDVGVFASCEGVEYCVSSGRYALVGAAALMCGITRATVSLTAIMFELTGGIDYVVPVMLTLLCSKWAGEMMGVTHGIYDCLIVQRGHQYIPIDVQITSRVPVAKIMVKHPVFLTVRDETLASIDRLLAKYPYKSFPVVSDSTLRLVDSVVFRYQLHDIVEGARRDGIDFQMPVLFSYREKLAKVNPSLRKFMGARAFNTAVDGGAGARRATRGRTKPKRTSSRSMSVPEGQTVESFPADEEREMDRALTYQDVEDPTTTDSDDVKVPPPAGVMWQRGSGREESDLDSTDLSRGDKHAERKDDDDYVGRVRRRWRPDKPSLAKQGVANARELHQCLCRQCCGMRQMGNYEKPPHLDLTRYVDPHPLVIFPDVLTNRVLQMFQSLGTACVLVIDSTGSLVGLVKKIDLLLHIESLKIYPEFAYGPPITRLRTAAEGEYQPLLSKSRSRDVEPTSDAEYIASANFHGYQKSYNSFADKQV